MYIARKNVGFNESREKKIIGCAQIQTKMELKDWM